MDWNDFFERTRQAANVDSFSKLAPMLGITDGAIGHYRQGRRVPQVWVVAEALKIQGHPSPEKAAIAIMKSAAGTSEERGFWKRLLATAAIVTITIALPLSTNTKPLVSRDFVRSDSVQSIYYVKNRMSKSIRCIRNPHICFHRASS